MRPVFITGPHWPVGAADQPATGPVRLHRAARRIVDETSELALDPELRVFIGDMVRPYGLPLREDLLAAGAGQSYAQLAAALLPEVVAGDPVDLLVLAFAIHDIRIGQATAVYLSSICPGGPLAFAICDQGAAAAFTGLRLIREYARAGDCRRAVLVVAEQSALHYQPAPVPGPPARIPDRHAAVALVFDAAAAGPALTSVRHHTQVEAAGVAGRLAAAVTELGPEAIVVAGAGLTGGALARAVGELPGNVVTAPAGQPYTGAWWELAGGLPEWTDTGRPVLLADYDPALRYLCLSTLDTSPARAARPAHGAARDTAGQLAR